MQAGNVPGAVMSELFKTVGIIGYGRFGRLMSEIFRRRLPEASIRISSTSNAADGRTFFSRQETCRSGLIIPCVPIRFFSDTISEIAGYVQPGQTILDVCSVKVHPRRVLLEKMHQGVNLICSHPMFGPASYQKLGGELQDCSVVLENVRSQEDIYQQIRQFFKSLGLHVIEMDADEHDRLAARFHFVTLTAATLLKKLQLRRCRIDTRSASTMLDFLEMISVDRELVRDLYNYNSYCKREFELLEGAFQELQMELCGRTAEDKKDRGEKRK